jgi:heme-degrading monooxygenase HmoA
MMHVRFSRISADTRVLERCIEYVQDKLRPAVESLPGSLGLSLLASPEAGAVSLESFWATHEAYWLSRRVEAPLRRELARRVAVPVTDEDYQVVIFEREAPLRSGLAVQVTSLKAEPAGAEDVIEVFGDTAVPRLAETPGFCAALLFADPASGQLISETAWQDHHARAASPSLAAMLQPEVLDQDRCEIRAVEDYRLVFSSARKPSVPE